MSGPTRRLVKAAAIVRVVFLLLKPTQSLWSVEDPIWTSELVNTSSLCIDPAVEDLNPEDPAIRLYSRRPQQQQSSFLRSVHDYLGRSLDADGHPQVLGWTEA